MNPQEAVDAIRAHHLKANISQYEEVPSIHGTVVVHWELAWIDPGGTIFGPGPYAKVPISLSDETGDDDIVVRVYPPARLRRRLAKALRD